MTYNRLCYIIQICYDIKPRDVKIRFVEKLPIDNPKKKICGLFYFSESSGGKICAVLKDISYLEIAHTLLHEICHAITYKKGWLDSSKKHRTYYLCEYIAEKHLRKICREYELWEILELSDTWIKKMLEKNEEDEYHNLYMARRLNREEKICKK